MRWAHVHGLARSGVTVCYSDDVLLAAARAVDDRDQNAAGPDQPAKHFGRRLDDPMDKSPIEALS